MTAHAKEMQTQVFSRSRRWKQRQQFFYHNGTAKMKTVSIFLISLLVIAFAFSDELPELPAHPAGYNTPVSIEKSLTDLCNDVPNEQVRALLRRLDPLDVKSSLLQYAAQEPAPKYASAAFEIATKGKMLKGCKLSWERREAKMALDREVAIVSYIDVFLLIGIDRDLTPFARDGEWRKILIRSVPSKLVSSN